MAYALRYYKEIAQTDGGVVRLEIHKKDSTTSAVEIGAVVQGLSLEIQGQQDDIDTPIQKTSLHMTFVDASDIENGQKNGFWEEFYTPDALMWKVVLKAKDAGETSFRTIWGGYVTPDSFSEDLVYRGSVSITARDNIGHMQDFPFDALGDADGLISLFNLVSMGWEKIQSPMDLLWNGLEWLSCNDVIAYHTLMNVSQFKDMNWYKAIETALASYGAVMRYAGENEVYVTTLRYMPSLGRNIDLMDRIDPVFIAGAQRELVPAVKRIEESVEYDLEESVSQSQIKVSDFSGSTETYRCKIDGVDSGNGSFGTAEHDAPIWSINNTENWANTAGKSLFFNPYAYEIGYFSDRRGLGDEIKRFMYIAANNVDERSVSFGKTITCADLAIRIKFGLPISLNSEGGSMVIEQQNVFNLKSIRYSVSLVQNGVTNYLASHGGWVVDKQEITTDFDTSSQVSDFECIIGMGEFLGQADLTFTIYKIEYAQMSYANLADYGLYACIQDFALATPTSLSLREKNTVNTLYNADNNVILSRDPEIGPAFDKVALPAFIKNGIFYRNGDEILPARLWSWGGSEQQMAVWNHLQLLCYYAKPNNLISGTIVNADITRVAAIYEWNHAEHILVSGRYNFLNGHIEGAVLREFARYEDMWSEVAGAAMPETEQDSRSNVEGGASSSSSPSTYTATQNVNIGTGGGGGTGASQLNDLTDVDVTGVVAQSVLYYNGTSWVDMSFASLVNPLLNPYLKSETAKATYATIEALNGLGTAVYTKQETNNLLAKYLLLESANQTIKGNITIDGNLVVKGDTSSGAKGTDGGVAGTLLGIKVNGTTYDKPVNGILTIPDYPTSLAWSAIEGKPTKLSQFTNDLGLGSLAYKNSLSKSDIGLGNVENKSSATIRGEITSSNVTNALGYTPLSTAGGTISSSSYGALAIHRTTNDGFSAIKYTNASGTLGYIGIGGSGSDFPLQPIFHDGTNSFGLIHSGNIGSQKVAGLVTPRTIWGQSFDGTGNVSGSFYINNESPIHIYDTVGTSRNALYLSSGNNLWIGYGTSAAQYNTIIAGYNTFFRYGGNSNTAISINSSGNVTVGASDLAGTIYRFYVNGVAKAMAFNGRLVCIDCSSEGVTDGYGGEINRFGGGQLWIQAREGGLQLGNSAGINFNGAVTMSSTLAVTGNISSSSYVTASRYRVSGNTSSCVAAANGYLSLNSFSNEMCIGGKTDGDFHINYRKSYDGTAPTTFIWCAGSASSRANHKMGSITVSGNAIITGDTSSGSDIRFKDKLSDHRIALSDIASAPLFTFKWNDREDDSVHLGSSAQYWEKVAPWLVKGEDFKTLDYSTLGVAIGISLANKTINLEDRVKILEKENKALKAEIRRIQHGS